jgi:hypothetical protein
MFRPAWLDFEGSMAELALPIGGAIADHQVRAAELGDRFVADSEALYGVAPEHLTDPVVAGAFAGVTQGQNYELSGGGLPVESVVERSAGVMQRAVAAGMGQAAVMQAGKTWMMTMAGTILQDTARNASWTRQNTSTVMMDYVRVIQPGACSRCIQLAGISTGRTTFKRHPRCRCYAAPVPEVPDGSVETDPQGYFEAMSKADQDRTFTKAGAEAIRAGADLNRVVNARAGAFGIKYQRHENPKGLDRPADYHPRTGRRLQKRMIGMGPDGKPIEVYATTELTGRRQLRSKRYRDGIRLMPEQILQMAGKNPVRYKELLRHYGYMW